MRQAAEKKGYISFEQETIVTISWEGDVQFEQKEIAERVSRRNCMDVSDTERRRMDHHFHRTLHRLP
jgi:hypothetical protein